VFEAEEDGDLYIGVRCYAYISDDTFDGEYNYVNDEDVIEEWTAMYHITATCNGKA